MSRPRRCADPVRDVFIQECNQPRHHSWQRAWASVDARSTGLPLLEKLIARYSEPHRKYHTLQHLSECIENLEAALPFAERAGEIEIALWFHDAIYELRSSENELQSANWAYKELIEAGAPNDSAERVHTLILATRHAALPVTPDEQLLVDADLSILGSPPDRFAEYESQVRQEYAWVPDLRFRTQRKTILKKFLDRPSIYSTAHFQTRLESQARENLLRSITQLGGQPRHDP